MAHYHLLCRQVRYAKQCSLGCLHNGTPAMCLNISTKGYPECKYVPLQSQLAFSFNQ